MGQVTQIDITGSVTGSRAGDKVLKELLGESQVVTEYNSGSQQLASGSGATITLGGIDSASFLMVRTEVSTTVTFADSQKLNVDGVAIMELNTAKSVDSFTAIHHSGSTQTISWVAAQ